MSYGGTEHWITVQLPAASHVSRVKLFWNPEYYAPAYKAGAEAAAQHIWGKSHALCDQRYATHRKQDLLLTFPNGFYGRASGQIVGAQVEVCGPDSCEGVVEEVSAADIEMFWTRKPQARGTGRACRGLYSHAEEVKLGLNGTYIKVTADPDRLSQTQGMRALRPLSCLCPVP